VFLGIHVYLISLVSAVVEYPRKGDDKQQTCPRTTNVGRSSLLFDIFAPVLRHLWPIIVNARFPILQLEQRATAPLAA
jgi:hypothetical protein